MYVHTRKKSNEFLICCTTSFGSNCSAILSTSVLSACCVKRILGNVYTMWVAIYTHYLIPSIQVGDQIDVVALTSKFFIRAEHFSVEFSSSPSVKQSVTVTGKERKERKEKRKKKTNPSWVDSWASLLQPIAASLLFPFQFKTIEQWDNALIHIYTKTVKELNLFKFVQAFQERGTIFTSVKSKAYSSFTCCWTHPNVLIYQPIVGGGKENITYYRVSIVIGTFFSNCKITCWIPCRDQIAGICFLNHHSFWILIDIKTINSWTHV